MSNYKHLNIPEKGTYYFCDYYHLIIVIKYVFFFNIVFYDLPIQLCVGDQNYKVFLNKH